MKSSIYYALTFAYMAALALAETVTFMKPTGNSVWVTENIENVEWKYSSDFNRISFKEARVDLMRGNPNQGQPGELMVHIHTEQNIDLSGVAFQLPKVAAGTDYYVRLSIVTGDGGAGEIYVVDSAPISIVDRASSANVHVLRNQKSVSNAKSGNGSQTSAAAVSVTSSSIVTFGALFLAGLTVF